MVNKYAQSQQPAYKLHKNVNSAMESYKLLELFLLIELLIKKVYNLVLLHFKWHGNPELIRRIAFKFNSYSWLYLQQKNPIIDKIGLIERSEIEYIYKLWKNNDDPLILYGEAGSGKSTIARLLGEEMTKIGIPVLFVKATDFSSDQDPIIALNTLLALPVPLFDAFAALGNVRPCSLIVDQLDDIAGTELCKKLIILINTIAGIKNVKVLVVSRSYEYNNDPDISNISFKSIESGKLTDEQTKQLLIKLGIKEPSQNLLALSNNLLNLSIIADLIEDPNLDVGDLTNEVYLWKKYFSTIRYHEGDEISEFALNLARKVTSLEEYTFKVEFPNSRIKRRLLSRNILHEISRNKFTFRHEQLRDFLCAYSLLPEQPRIEQIIYEFGTNASKNVILWLHRFIHTDNPGYEPEFIDMVLNAREILPYYSRILILENLRSQTNPSVQTAFVISKNLPEKSYQLYFFKDLKNPAWMIPLYESGSFNHPPDPIEVQPGSYQLPGWPAGEYLVTFANLYENVVEETVKTINTQNSRVHETLIDALERISPSKAAELVDFVDSWLNSRFSTWLPFKLISLTDYLYENGFISAAIKIFEYVITPAFTPKPEEYSEYYSRIKFRSDHYAVNDYVDKQKAKLIQINPLEMTFSFERQINKAIALAKNWKADEGETLVGYIWRLDIPTYLDGRDETNALDTLIDGLRDSLLEVCKTNIEEGGRVLASFLSSEHIILKRIAMYGLRSCGQNYPLFLENVLLNRENLEKAEFANEYRGLLRYQFANLTKETQAIVVSWILSGPIDIESRLSWITEWEKREPTENDRKRVQEEWIHFHLGIIQSFLGREALITFDKLTEKYGKPDISEKPRFVVSSVEETPSPIAIEELEKMNFGQLKNLFLTFTPDEHLPYPHETLGRDFHRLIIENPSKYLEFSPYLIDPNIRFIYLYQYLSGIQEGVRNKGVKLTDELIDLCDFIVNNIEEPFHSTAREHEPGLINGQMEVARLLEVCLWSNDSYLTRTQLDRIRSLLIKLVHHKNPTIDEDNKTSLNAFTHSLNCIRGLAMHGIFHYSLYVVRKENKENNTQNHFIEPEIQRILEEKLISSSEPSPAVRSVFGAFLSKIYFLDKKWLKYHLSDIFPSDEAHNSYWKAAWDGFIFNNRVHSEIFQILMPQYKRGLTLLSQTKDEQKNFGGSPDERLAQHIMFAYLNDLTDFDHENEILDLFFEHAPDLLRAQGILWLSEVIESHKPSIDTPVWQKCWVLWKKRISSVEGEEIKENSLEISEYLRWLKNCPQDLGDLYDILMMSTKYLHDSYDVKLLKDFLVKYCNQFPLEAVAILQMEINNEKEPRWISEEDVEGQILRVALTSNNDKARRVAIEIINYRGEQGDFRWKSLLNL